MQAPKRPTTASPMVPLSTLSPPSSSRLPVRSFLPPSLLPPNPNRSSSPFARSPIRTSNPLKSSNPLLPSASSDSPPPSLPPTDEDHGENEEEIVVSEMDHGDGIEIEVVKVGRNRRRVEAKVGVEAELETVWGLLTDYEGLARFIPSLAVCELLEKRDGFAKIYQVGQQDLALGLKFNAKGVLDCYEKDLELLPSRRRRDIEFGMVDGDFKTFEGIWSIVQDENQALRDHLGKQLQTTLSYVVELEPKLWLPVRLLEGRICKEIRINLSSVRDEAQRIQRTI